VSRCRGDVRVRSGRRLRVCCALARCVTSRTQPAAPPPPRAP
jgi:hypothetical protein